MTRASLGTTRATSSRCLRRKVRIVLHEAEVSHVRTHQAAWSGPGKELLEEPAKKRRIAFVWTANTAIPRLGRYGSKELLHQLEARLSGQFKNR